MKAIFTVTLALMATGAFWYGFGSLAKGEEKVSAKPVFTQFTAVPAPDNGEVKANLKDDKQPVQVSQDKTSLTFSYKNNGPKNTIFFAKTDCAVGLSEDNVWGTQSLSVDLGNTQIIMGDGGDASNWGIKCDSKAGCTSNETPCTGQSYRGTPFDCNYGNMDVALGTGSDDLKPQTPKPLVTLTTADSSTFPLGATGVLGMAPGSEYLKNVLAQYKLTDSVFEFSFDYQINNRDSRYSGDKDDTFAITMWAFGKSTEMMQNPSNQKTVQMTSPYWALPSVTYAVSSSPATAQETAYITTSSNDYFSLPEAQVEGFKQQVKQALGCTLESACPKSEAVFPEDKYLLLTFVDDAKQTIKLNCLYSDIAYYQNDSQLTISVGSIEDLVKKGLVPSDAKLALGTQFVVNTYLNFRVKSGGYEIQVGQLLDLGKITPTERLLLLLFGLGIVAIILIVLAVKVCSKKGAPQQGDYVRQEA